jgi:hypothetical protein
MCYTIGIVKHKELEMPKFVHIVYVHPVELGEPNLHKVKHEAEFQFYDDALNYVKQQNRMFKKSGDALQAVYYGCVNDATGELV